MFNVNLLNKPGEQEEDTKNNFISSNPESSDNNININKRNEDKLSDAPSKSSLKDKKIDLFSIIIIFLVIGIILSMSLAYYFGKL